MQALGEDTRAPAVLSHETSPFGPDDASAATLRVSLSPDLALPPLSAPLPALVDVQEETDSGSPWPLIGGIFAFLLGLGLLLSTLSDAEELS